MAAHDIAAIRFSVQGRGRPTHAKVSGSVLDAMLTSWLVRAICRKRLAQMIILRAQLRSRMITRFMYESCEIEFLGEAYFRSKSYPGD